MQDIPRTVSVRKVLTVSSVNAVYVYDDKLVLTFNYNKANTTVTLDEVNGSIIECSGAPEKPTYFDKSVFLLNPPIQVGEILTVFGRNRCGGGWI